MAQIWLTYDELADFCGCPPATARIAVANNQWARRKSSDGLTRVKLPQSMMRDFIGRMAVQWQGGQAEVEFSAAPLAIAGPSPFDVNGHVDHDALADHVSGQLRAALSSIAPDRDPGKQRTA